MRYYSLSQKIVLVLLASLLLIAQSSAVGIGFAGSPRKIINFEPFRSAEYEYWMRTYTDFSNDYTIYAEMKGDTPVDLTPYVRIDPPEFKNVKGTFPFTVYVDLPESIDMPGTHTIFIYVLEGGFGSTGGGIRARTEVGADILVNVLYPGISIKATMRATNVNMGEKSNISIDVTNWGTVPLISADADITVYDNRRKKVGSFTLHHKGVVQPWESFTMYKMFDTDGLPAGNYLATAELRYYNRTMYLNDTFIIGTKNVEVINHTRRLFVDKISLFDVTVKSHWNTPIGDLEADIIINGRDVRTPGISLDALGVGNLSTYFSTAGFEPGFAPLEIILYYEGHKTIYNGHVELVRQPVEEEIPLALPRLNIMIILILIIIIVLLINIILLLIWRDRKEKEEKEEEKGKRKKHRGRRGKR